MCLAQASAPGKVILFGEHAVVYGQPALAVPVTQVQATATLTPRGEGIWIDARDLNRHYRLEDASPNDPLAAAVRLTFSTLQLSITEYSFLITLHSTIPIASGLGSGAAVCTALVRALSNYFNSPLSNAQASALVFETERLLHGTPSGIDNTVVAYGQPVYFVKGQPPVPFSVAQPFRLLIADTGLPSPTKITVGEVRAARQKEPERYEAMFRAIGDLSRKARHLIESPQTSQVSETCEVLGALMNRNHAILREMGVSCVELDALVEAARAAGALGAKLSGGGRGGNMLALVTPETETAVRAALEMAGAKRVIATTIGK
jgi:mevalonate kinase